MTTWLLPPRSGATLTTSARAVYTGTVGIPVAFEDADVNFALSQGWTYSERAPVDELGKLIGVPAALALDEDGDIEGLINPKNGAVYSLNPILAQFAVPIILPPGNGSTTGLQLSGTTGGFTITTSTFPAAGSQGFAYPQGCYMVIPAGNGIGLTAGTYYAVLTSASAGTLFANTLPAGQVPTLITSPTALSGLTSGSWLTQVTTVQDLVTIPMPGGSIGNNGSCELYIQNAVFQSANQKTTSFTVGGTSFYSVDFGGGASSSNGQMLAPRFFNRGNQNNQVAVGGFGTGLTTAQTSGLATQRPQVDLSANQNIVIRAQLASNTDWYSLESVMIRINQKP